MKNVLYAILVLGLVTITYSVALLFFDSQSAISYVKINQTQAVLGATDEANTGFADLLNKAVGVYPNYLKQ